MRSRPAVPYGAYFIKYVISLSSYSYYTRRLTAGMRLTATCVWRLVFVISMLFDAP